MTNVGLAQPFVWLYIKTADDNYTTPVRFPLTGSDFFVEFQDDSLFSMGDADVPGSGASKTGRAMTRIKLIDPSFTYLEGLLVRNRFLSFEYGWTDEYGNILETSGSIRSMVGSIVPRFTYSGTELELTLISDLSVSNDGSEIASMLNATTVSSKLFISTKSQGSEYKVKGAGVDISKIVKDNKLYDEEGPGYVEEWVPASPDSDLPRGSKVKIRRKPPPRATKGTALALYLAQNASSIARFERISDIVVYIATICGMEYDVDETAYCLYDIYLMNKTLHSFIKDDLVSLAKDDRGVADYKYWVRGNKLFFKRSQGTNAVKKLEFIGDHKSVTDRFSDSARKSIVLDFQLTMMPNLIVNSSSVSTKVVGYDPINKKPTGRHAAIVKSPDIMTSIYSEIQSIDLADNREVAGAGARQNDAYGGRRDELDVISKEGNNISRSNYKSVQSDWLVWETASQLVNYFSQQSPNMDKTAQDKLQLAAYRALLKRRNAGLDQELYQPSDAVASIKSSDVKTLSKVSPVVGDPTKAGRMYVLPYADSRSADMAEGILSSSMRGPFFAKCTCYGDPSVHLLQAVLMLIHTPDGYHYSSGRYLVQGVVNKIDAAGFTTEISLVTDGVYANRDLSELIAEADGPSPEEFANENKPVDQLGDNKDTVSKPILKGGAVEALWQAVNGDDQ